MRLAQTCGSNLRATCAWPLVQRACCARQAAAVCGNSPGTISSGSMAARQSRIVQRMERSRSSVSVSPVQPPPSSIAVRDHTPAVPLNEMGKPARKRASCSTAKWESSSRPCTRVSQLALRLAWPQRACTKAKTGIAQQHRHGLAQEIGRRHEIGVEDRHIGRVAMFEPEGEIAGLEAGAVAAAQDFELHAFGRHGDGVARQLRHGRRLVAVIQKLNGEPVLGPVHPGRGFDHADRQQAFIADRELHQHMGQFSFRQDRGVKGMGISGRPAPRPAPPAAPKACRPPQECR